MTQTKQKKQLRPLLIASLSAFGIWAGDMLLYPIDTIAVRMRANHSQSQSFWAFTKKTIKEKKISNLYKGFSSTFFTSFLPFAINLYVYELLRIKISKFVDQHSSNKTLKLCFPFFIGGLAQLSGLLIQLPFDTVRTRLQVDDPIYSYKSLRQAVATIYKNQGFIRFYRSSKIFISNMILFGGIQLQVYQILQFYTEHTFINSMINMLLVTVISCTLCNPLDLLLTRYALVDTSKQQLNFRKMVSGIIKHEGFMAFYKGYVARTIGAIGFNLFWFPVYSLLRQKYSIQLSD